MKVKLPGADIFREMAFVITKSDANLDDLEEVDVTSHSLVVVV